MVPDWLAVGASPPDGTVEELLTAAQALVPPDLLAESGLADEVAECAKMSYFHLWMNSLQDVGWFAQEAGRDADLTRANLSHARLAKADLRGANLSDVDLRTTDIQGARMDIVQAVQFARCYGARIE